MNILVTGGAGFIGSHLCERLLTENHKIVCFDNFSGIATSYDHKWANIRFMLGNDKFKLAQGDIQKKEDIEAALYAQKIDAVIHLAAQTGVRPSVQDPILHYKVNVLGIVNLLQLCVKYKIMKMVFASSSSIYGNNPHVPFSENDKSDSPLSPYAATKKSGENICYVFHKLYNLNITCIRPFTVYGPRQRKEMAISSFTKKINSGQGITIFGDGKNSRDYTYVSDVVEGFVSALYNLNGYEVYNIGRGNPVMLSRLISIIEEQLGKRATIDYSPMQPGEADNTYADITKAGLRLEYKPQVGIEEGVSHYIDWYLKQEAKI